MPGNCETTQLGVLLVDDEAEIRTGLGKILRAAGYPCVSAASAGEALKHLAGRDFAVVVSDIVMPGMGGMELLAEIRARFRSTDTVLITGSGTIELAVEAMKMGARDFLTKPFPPGQLVETVSRLLRNRVDQEPGLQRSGSAICPARGEPLESAPLECADLSTGPEDRFEVGDGGEIIGRSPSARRICEMVQRLRGNMTNVLICGDTGSGKELVARAIHYGSARSGGPFIAVNCAGVPRSLAENHFFGHVRGAYTGAATDAKGFFRAADGGTLFLDEVTEVSLDFQAVLLRAIQEREVVPVGSTVPESVDVRVIAATSKHGRRAVHAGLLREDLYYRLAVACVCVPPLRDHTEDIPLLVNHFLTLHAEQFRCAPKRVSRRAMDCMKAHDWPGNVRELSNVIERAYALGTEPTISVEDLASEGPPRGYSTQAAPPAKAASFGKGGCTGLRRAVAASVAQTVGRPAEGTITLRLSKCSLDEAQRAVIERALEETGGNKNKAAKMLGINRATLYRKLARFGWRAGRSDPLGVGSA